MHQIAKNSNNNAIKNLLNAQLEDLAKDEQKPT